MAFRSPKARILITTPLHQQRTKPTKPLIGFQHQKGGNLFSPFSAVMIGWNFPFLVDADCAKSIATWTTICCHHHHHHHHHRAFRHQFWTRTSRLKSPGRGMWSGPLLCHSEWRMAAIKWTHNAKAVQISKRYTSIGSAASSGYDGSRMSYAVRLEPFRLFRVKFT